MHIAKGSFRKRRNFAISLVYGMVRDSGRAVLRLLGMPAPGRCVVVCYHSILPEERAAFWRQMDELAKMATTVRADKTSGLAPGALHVAITFDDAFTHIVVTIIPQLVARGIASTLFVPSGFIGAQAAWYQAPYSRDCNETVATADELRLLPPEMVLIGSHSVSHRDMPLLSQQDAEWELRESRATLERELGRPVTTFAFPYAKYNARLVTQCRDAGYVRVFTGQAHREPTTQQNFVVGRVRVDPTDTPSEFRLKIQGAYDWLPLASAVKQWLRGLLGATNKTKGPHDADLRSQEDRSA